MDRHESVSVESIEGLLLGLMGHRERNRLLASLGYWMTHASRGSYVAAGRQVEDAAAELTCLNELCMRVFEQLAADAGTAGIGYPDQAFARVLAEKAVKGGCGSQLEWALARATR
jgi:hypothetical protein